MNGPVGVLVMAHGTPGSAEEIGPFYTRIRRGRPPTPEQLADLLRRYEAIGGVSPLAERTGAQVEGIARRLEAQAPGRYRVAFGAKHTEPFIEGAASALAGSGVAGVVGLVLTPQRSARGSGEYLERAAEAIEAAAAGLRFVAVEEWFDAPGFAELLGERLRAALERAGAGTEVVFTAHSVPETGLPDPYRGQVERTAELVAAAVGLDGSSVPWRVAWQSAGRTEQRWIGPDLGSTIDELASAGRRSVVVCPVGFVSDHLEVLYDLDIEARARATAAGIGFSRTASLNDDPGFLDVLARVVTAADHRGGRR